MRLERDSTGASYTTDRRFKIKKCAVRKYGWEISERRADGQYRHVCFADSLADARRKIEEQTERKENATS